MSSMNIQEIFEAITPENIKQIPLMASAMEIFIEMLEENCQVSIDVSKIWDNVANKSVVGGRESESEILVNAKNNVRELMLETYTNVLYTTLKAAQTNRSLYEVFERDGITDSPLNGEVRDIIDDEYFSSNKIFNEMVGTIRGLEYAYNLGQYVESREFNNDLVVTSPSPFIYNLQGSIYHETFEAIVKPLAHPLGFVYNYQQITNITLNDQYGIKDKFDFSAIEIRQIDGWFFVFTDDITDDSIKTTFLTNRINPLTNEVFTLAEYNTMVSVYKNKTVLSYADLSEQENYKILRFVDGTCLLQYTDTNEIFLCDYNDFLMNTQSPDYIRSFSTHASLYLEYIKDVEFEYTDEFDFDVEPLFDEYVDITDGAISDDITFTNEVTSGSYLVMEDSYLYTSDGFYIYVFDNEETDD